MPDPIIGLPGLGGGIAGLGADAAGLQNILGLLFGKPNTTVNNTGGTSNTTTTGPSTVTNETVVDPAAIEYTMRTMLEGNGSTSGLAALLTGEHAAGGYSGSMASLQTNDLVSRIVGAVANLTKKTIQTNSGATTTSNGTNNSSSTTSQDGQAKQLAALLAALKAASAAGKGSQQAPKAPTKPTKPGGVQDTKKPDNGIDKTPDPAFGLLNDTDFVNAIDESALDSSDFTEKVGEDAPNDGPTPVIDIGDITPVYDSGEVDPWETGGPGDALDLGPGDDGGGGDGDTGDGTGDTGDGENGYVESDDDSEGDYGGGGEDGGCYITTAVIGSRGLPDNCPELQILRAFRDSWLKIHHPEGIKLYYEDAPTLVTKINSLPDSGLIYNRLYYTYILPAIGKILRGDMVGGYDKYREMVVYVQRIS